MSFLSRMSFPVALLLVLVWAGQPTVLSATQPAAGTDAPRAERPPRLSNKWRLEFSGAAESAGEIVLEIVPRGEAPVLVRAVIERNDGENRVARKVKTAIDRQAGRWVDAELDDGELESVPGATASYLLTIRNGGPDAAPASAVLLAA